MRKSAIGALILVLVPIRLVPYYFKQLPLDGEATCKWLGK